MDIKQIWQEYKHQLQRFLRSRVSNAEDAEDLLQEILIKTHQQLHTVQDPEKLRAWLFQVTRNAVIDYYRQSHKKPPVPADFMEDSSEPSDQAHQELSDCIRPFLEQLPETYQAAVEAVDLRGVSQKGLAEELGLSHSAVKSRVQRGRKMLASLFQECCRYELDARGNIVDYQQNKDCC